MAKNTSVMAQEVNMATMYHYNSISALLRQHQEAHFEVYSKIS